MWLGNKQTSHKNVCNVLCVESASGETVNPADPSNFITRLLESILKNSIFQFNKELYQ